MQKKFDELIDRFSDENNTAGVRITTAVKEYMDTFTKVLANKLELEEEYYPGNVNKVVNLMIECDAEEDYTGGHFYPVLNESGFNIVKSENNDKEVIKHINAGISKTKEKSGLEQYTNRINIGYVYLEISHAELMEISKQAPKYKLNVELNDGSEKELEYYLVWSDLAIKKCKRIWNMSRIYKCEEPIVYVPYAKRLFSIEVDIQELSANDNLQIQNLDLQLNKNGIQDKILLDKELVWNIKIDEPAGIEPVVSPVNEILHWRYQFCELLENQYIMPKRIKSPTFRIIFRGNDTLEYDFESEYPDGFEKITIYNVDEILSQRSDIFSTGYNTNGLKTQYRLRSEADLHYELEKFCKPDYSKIVDVKTSVCGSHNITKTNTDMVVYDKGRFGYKNTNRVYVKFEVDDTSLFYEDYANFVLGYLTYCFPEIGWEGVY